MTPAQRLYRKHWAAIQTAQKEKHRYYAATSPTYRELRKLRTRINNFKISIEEHQELIRRFQGRLGRAIRRKEVLELAWGRERAALKRSGKWKRFSKYDYMASNGVSDTHVRE